MHVWLASAYSKRRRENSAQVHSEIISCKVSCNKDHLEKERSLSFHFIKKFSEIKCHVIKIIQKRKNSFISLRNYLM